MLGREYSTTTTPASTTTSTYTADPTIGELEQKLAALQKLLEGGGTSSEDLVAEIELIKGALAAASAGMVQEKKRVDAKFTVLEEGLKAANDNIAVLTAALQALQAGENCQQSARTATWSGCAAPFLVRTVTTELPASTPSCPHADVRFLDDAARVQRLRCDVRHRPQLRERRAAPACALRRWKPRLMRMARAASI